MDHVTDIIFFGAIVPCEVKECKNGNFIFDGNTTYRCTGRLSEFGDCNKKIKVPERKPVKITPEILEAYPILNREFKVVNRFIKDNPKPSKAKRSLKPKRVQKPKFKEMLMKGIHLFLLMIFFEWSFNQSISTKRVRWNYSRSRFGLTERCSCLHSKWKDILNRTGQSRTERSQRSEFLL